MVTKRQEKILSAIIYEYTQKGQPVSSLQIVNKYFPDLSSATVRNEMLNLEEKGFLIKPHISAGRIPSDKGYRYFVDYLLKPKKLSLNEQKKLEIEVLKLQAQNERLSQAVTKLLALNSHCLALAGIIDRKEFFDFGLHWLIDNSDFKKLDDVSKLLAVLDFLDNKLDKIINYLKEEKTQIFIGKENPIKEMRQCSMIISPYLLNSGEKGIIALIGSKRMSYGRNKTLIDFFKKIIKKRERKTKF